MVSQWSSLIRINTYYAYFKDWKFTFSLCRAPKCSFPAFKDLYEVCAPALWTSVTNAWGINIWWSHPDAWRDLFVDACLESTVSYSAVSWISHSYFSLPKLTAYQIYMTMDASSFTPAWNPPEDQPLVTNTQIASKQPDRPQHPLLDERLVGAQPKVVVNNGESYKDREVFISIARVEGVVSIRHHVYNTSKACPLHGCQQKVPIQHVTMVFSW